MYIKRKSTTMKVVLALLFPFLISAKRDDEKTRSIGKHKHENMVLLHDPGVPTEIATLGVGRFFAAESHFGGKVGVIRTKVGYTGGKSSNPTYENLKGHSKVIQIDFDPKVLNYTDLLKDFWKIHDPTHEHVNGYASIIMHHSLEQKKIALKALVDHVYVVGRVATQIEPAVEFFNAEDHLQKYYLQQDKQLYTLLQFNSTILRTSHVATRLNAYIVGQTPIKQFDEEAPKLGLNKEIIDFVRPLVIEYQKKKLPL